MDRRLTFEACLKLFASGMSQQKIAAELKISRSTAQRMIWLSGLSAPVQEAYFNGQLRQDQIFTLHRGDLSFDDLVLRKPLKRQTPTRTEYEVLQALDRATNRSVRATLEWVLKKRNKLPHD